MYGKDKKKKMMYGGTAKKKMMYGSHKMPNGHLHSNKTHTKTSVRLYHFKDLSKTAQKKAKGKK